MIDGRDLVRRGAVLEREREADFRRVGAAEMEGRGGYRWCHRARLPIESEGRG